MSDGTEPLDREEVARYRRHLVLPEIGGAGQQKLKAARVLVVGAGGLGAPAIAYLAAAGVGLLRIVDDDVTDISNLQRQVIHRTGDVGTAKTASARRFANDLNPFVAVDTISTRLGDANADALLAGMTLALDGTDSLASRRVLAAACARAAIPLVTGAVGRFDGSVTVIAPHLRLADGSPAPRFQDLFPDDPPDGLLPACAETGIVGALTGVIGTLMAMEAIKIVTGAGAPLIGRLMLYDGLAARFSEIGYRRPKR